MQGAKAAEILAEYGLKPSDIIEWPAIAPNDTENLHRLARVFIMNRHLQTQSGCEPLVWKPLPPVEDPEEKKHRDAAGLLPAEWDSIKVCACCLFLLLHQSKKFCGRGITEPCAA